jgi:hypothetical protein
MGKGDTYRPVNQKLFGENYDDIFRTDKTAKQIADNTGKQTAATESRESAGQNVYRGNTRRIE